MSFLNPIAFWGFLALAIPVILHLLKQSPARPKDWAAMEFLLEREALSARKYSLRRWLLLLSRLLFVACLVMALAQPIGSIFTFQKNSPDTVFILLDRGAEMNAVNVAGGPTLREQAIEKVQKALRGGNPRLYLIDSASLEVTPILSQEALPLLSQVSQTDLSADLSKLLDKAVSTISQGEYGNVEVWVLSSNDEHLWKTESPRWESMRNTLNDSGDNILLKYFSLQGGDGGDQALYLKDTEKLDGRLLLNLRVEGVRYEQSLLLSGETNTGDVLEYTLDVSPNQLDYQVLIPMEAGVIAGELAIPEDLNSRNNTVYFSSGPPAEIKTLVVTESGEDEVTQHLMKAVALSSRPQYTVKWINPDDFLLADLSEYELVIWLANGDSLTRDILEEYLQTGKRALIFPSFAGESSKEGWFYSQMKVANQGEFFTVSEWNEKDGPWRNSINGERLPLDLLQVIQTVKVKVEGSAVLARYDEGEVLLQRSFFDDGVAYFCSSIPHRSWSNIENLGLHVVMIQRILGSISKNKGGGYMQRLEVGEGVVYAGLYGEEKITAYNRPFKGESRPLEKGEIKKLIKNTGFSEVSSKGNTFSSWAHLVLMWSVVFLLIEAVLQLSIWPRTKEASHG